MTRAVCDSGIRTFLIYVSNQQSSYELFIVAARSTVLSPNTNIPPPPLQSGDSFFFWGTSQIKSATASINEGSDQTLIVFSSLIDVPWKLGVFDFSLLLTQSHIEC